MSKCFYSTSCQKNVPLKDVLKECRERGLEHIELSAPHPVMPLNEIKSLMIEYKNKGFSFLTHNYFPPQTQDFFLNIASFDSQIQDLSEKIARETLELAKSVQAPVYGIHSGFLADAKVQPHGCFDFNPQTHDRKKCLDQAARFIQKIAGDFEKGHVALALENLFPIDQRDISLGCSWPDICDLMSVVPKDVGLLLDLGHLNISANLMGFKKFQFLDKYLSKFGERLYEVHLSDNHGVSDDHLPLKEDSWQLDVLREIATVPINRKFERVYCLEARNAVVFEPIQKSMAWIEECLDKTPLNSGV